MWVLFAPQEGLELRPVKGPPQLAARGVLHHRNSDAVLLHQTQIVGNIHRLKAVLALLQNLNRDRGLTVIIITHNPSIAAIAGRTLRLVSGRIAESTVNERPIAAEAVSW